jgi:hypothetical protein
MHTFRNLDLAAVVDLSRAQKKAGAVSPACGRFCGFRSALRGRKLGAAGQFYSLRAGRLSDQ